MSIFTRQLPVAACAAVALCAGAAPAVAHSRSSSSAAVTAKTPLVAKIAAEADQVEFGYQLSRNSIQRGLEPTAGPQLYYTAQCERAASAVQSIHADSAQLTAQREWVLGVYMEALGDNALGRGEYQYVYGFRTSGAQSVSASLTYYRLSNYYIAHADASLGITHRARNVEPYGPSRDMPVPPGPGTLSTPVGLAATITMGAPAVHEAIPDDVETSEVDANEAATRYYSVIIADMHVDGTQLVGRQDWVRGVQRQLLGDDLLARGEHTHSFGNPATGNREMKDALGILREADSEIGHADKLLGVHVSTPSATLPAHPVYYAG